MVQFYYILAKLKFLKVYVVNLELFGSTAPLPCVFGFVGACGVVLSINKSSLRGRHQQPQRPGPMIRRENPALRQVGSAGLACQRGWNLHEPAGAGLRHFHFAPICSRYGRKLAVCTRSVARRRRKDPGALCPSPSDTGEGSALTSNLVAFQEIWRRAIGCWNRARISTQRILAVGRLCAGPCRCYTYNESTG